jgi:DNA modification methylase
VWEVTASEGLRYPADKGKHFAAYPAELVRRIVTGWCPPDGVVFDPFAGSGTTSLVARMLGYDSISTDMSANYVKLARWRVYASDHRARLEERWKKQGLI